MALKRQKSIREELFYSEQHTPILEKQLSLQFVPRELREEQDEMKRWNQSIVVGSGIGGLYIDQTFGFGDRESPVKAFKRLTLNKRFTRFLGNIDVDATSAEKLFDEFSSLTAWFILCYYCLNNALIPPWIMSIDAEKYLRVSWRNLLQAIFLIPFVMYEYRTGTDKTKTAFTLEFLTNWSNMRKLYISSCSATLTSCTILFCNNFTNVSTVYILIAQTNFWLSMLRDSMLNHKIEIGGKIMCIIGFILIGVDNYLLNPDSVPEYALSYRLSNLYFRDPIERILVGNVLPIFISLVLANLSKQTADLKSIVPPFLNMFIVSIFVSLNVLMFSYFIDGTSIDFNVNYGWFGLFKNSKFISFFYMSTIISLGLLISSVLISKLFEPIIAATATLFEPIITSILVHLFELQYFPGTFSCFGYVFLIPGQFVIVLGQTILDKQRQLEIQKLLEMKNLNQSCNPNDQTIKQE